TGYFTLRIAERVPEGQVFAVDVQEPLLKQLQARANAAGLTQVTPVRGAADDPRLPADSIDVALIVDAYNEFSHPREMMQAIRRALRPGGQLVVVEFRGEDATVPLPDLHRMAEAQLRRELEAVGFRWRETRDMLPQQHYLVFDSPADGRSRTN
ncbi:MAG: methyltransferase domain-containing protein, partial [Bacteroidetes bacterium]|nr:methyltransferase domain-containing protein [Bacteroidota bacterium]